MSESCLPLEILAEVSTLDPADPRREHLDRCPRCRARLAAFRAFMDTGYLPPGADLLDAEARLGAALRAEIFGHTEDLAEGQSERQTAPVDEAAPAAAKRTTAPFFRRPAGGRQRALMALAAVLVLALGVVFLTDVGDSPRRSPLLRGNKEGALAPFQAAVTELPDGRLRLTWQPIAGADAYRVLLFGPDLVEQARREAGPATSLVLDRRDLPSSLQTVIWRVIALRGGDPVARSEPQVLAGP